MQTVISQELLAKANAARAAARRMAYLPTKVKNEALARIAEVLLDKSREILEANTKDIDAARAEGMDEAMLDRLRLDQGRLQGMAAGVKAVVALPDPVGEISEMRTLPSGIAVGRRRVPLGIVGFIYEARPNVTVDAAALSIKSGNAIILKGGSEALNSNSVLARVISDTATSVGLPQGVIQFIESRERAVVGEMLKMRGLIDVIIPRGGQGLIDFVLANSLVPVLAAGGAVCHVFVDQSADLYKAVPVIINAKTQRPTVCNALDTLLVHQAVADKLLPRLVAELGKLGVELRLCSRSSQILKSAGITSGWTNAQDSDFGKEFLALILAVKTVSSLDDALDHIFQHSTGHTESILTENYTNAQRFLTEVDSGVVMVNASTRFNDGGEFGLGAEIGISTGRLHARGPMVLAELTTQKWVVMGSGQIRG